MIKEYHEIGEVFEFEGKRLKVVEDKSACGLCAFCGICSSKEIACCLSERKDRKDVYFVETTEPLTNEASSNPDTKRLNLLKEQLFVLKEVMQTYSGKTIDNIVMQMEARINEMQKGGKE